MRVVFGVDTYSRGDGISRVVDTTAIELKRLGHQVIVVCGKHDGRLNGTKIVAGYHQSLSQSSIRKSAEIVKRCDPDFFYSHYYPMDIVGAIVMSEGVPHIMHWHGIAGLTIRKSPGSAIGWTRANAGAFIGCHKSAQVLSISEFAADYLINRFHLQESRISVIGNPIDTEKFSPPEYPEKPHMCRKILSVAGITPIKGQLQLVKVAEKLRAMGKVFSMTIAGMVKPGGLEYFESIKAYISNHHLEDVVTLTGTISEKDLIGLYKTCDIFAFGSSWESFGLPVAEAMACGKPVVGFDVASLPELVQDGITGFLVPRGNLDVFADRLEHLIANPERCLKMGARGRAEIVTRFSVKEYTNRLTDQIRDCLT